MIEEETYKQALAIVQLYEQQQRKKEIIKSLPVLEEGMILEYFDLSGNWYVYTQYLQENTHFIPIKTRVRLRTVPKYQPE